jgi:hypothetical protein
MPVRIEGNSEILEAFSHPATTTIGKDRERRRRSLADHADQEEGALTTEDGGIDEQQQHRINDNA